MQIPLELWDLILLKLSEINIKFLVFYRLTSKLSNELILNNKDIKFKLFLLLNKLFYASFNEQFRWIYKHKSCNKTRLEALKRLAKIFKLTNKDIRSNNYYILKLSCGYDHYNRVQIYFMDNNIDSFLSDKARMKVVKWLINTFKLTAEDIIHSNAFGLACRSGHLRLAKWIIETFNLEEADIVRFDHNFAFRISCKYGHIEVAKWLVNIFNLTIDDIEDNSNYALIQAFRYNHLDIVKWLIETFNITIRNKNLENKIFRIINTS